MLSFNRRGVLLGTASLIASPALARLPSDKAARAGGMGRSNAPASRFDWTSRPMLQADMRHALDLKVQRKQVHESLSIDDMEVARGWKPSAPVSLTYTSERARVGTRSLRFTTQQRDEAFIRQNRNKNGSFAGDAALFDQLPAAPTAQLTFDQPQDWTKFNRISLWCFVGSTGNPVNNLCVEFTCLGAPAGPSNPIAVHYFADLKEGEWNYLAWEIPEHQRDKVIDVTIFVPVWGLPFPNVKNLLSLDIDDLRVDRVDPEQVDGWSVAAGTIAFSHVGYRREAPKVAIGADGNSRQFDLLDDSSGQIVATFPVRQVSTNRGHYEIYDFSPFHQEGTFRLRTANAETRAFRVGDEPWHALAEATLNGFYGLRCGFAVAGAYAACHCDVLVRHGSDLRVIGGGWHDAANLSQDSENTHVSVCALFDLYDSLVLADSELAGRALEEAMWGLEWILRMRFGPGVRNLSGRYTYFTDGKVGTDDDIVLESVGSNVFFNVTAALACAKGARRLHTKDATYAAQLLKASEEDFATVLRDRPEPPREDGSPNWHVQPWQNEAGYIVLAAAELYQATRKQDYADVAVKYGRWLLDLQERRFLEGSPITGYFYEDAGKTRIPQEMQRTSGAPNSFEEGALLGLAALCDILPDHSDWIEWRGGLAAYSEYFCASGAEASRPFEHIPAAVWRKSDLSKAMPEDFGARLFAGKPNAVYPSASTPDFTHRQITAMYEAGTYLSPNQRLRTFPLWTDHVRHGGTAVHLTKTIGLLAAARGRKNLAMLELGERQIQWTTGANPFSRSLVYGVGYDWWQNFTVSLPNMVGNLSVGMNSYRDDSPAWGQNAVFPYKEVWIASSARLAGSLAGVCGRAVVQGMSPGAQFRNLATGQVFQVRPGHYKIRLMPGVYEVQFGDARRRITLMPGARDLQLDPERFIDLEASWEGQPENPSGLRLTARGTGRHALHLRTLNLAIDWKETEVDLYLGRPHSISCSIRVQDVNLPWLVVASAGGNVSEFVELLGSGVRKE